MCHVDGRNVVMIVLFSSSNRHDLNDRETLIDDVAHEYVVT